VDFLAAEVGLFAMTPRDADSFLADSFLAGFFWADCGFAESLLAGFFFLAGLFLEVARGLEAFFGFGVSFDFAFVLAFEPDAAARLV